MCKINIQRHQQVGIRRKTGQGSNSFCPVYKILRAEEVGNPEVSIGADKKGGERKQPSKTENLQIRVGIFQPNTTKTLPKTKVKILWPHPYL